MKVISGQASFYPPVISHLLAVRKAPFESFEDINLFLCGIEILPAKQVRSKTE